jgi:hypothetical protein
VRVLAVAPGPQEYGQQASGRQCGNHAGQADPAQWRCLRLRGAAAVRLALRATTPHGLAVGFPVRPDPFHKKRAVDFDERPFEFRVAACFFLESGDGFQIPCIQGVQVMQRQEIPRQMVS